MAKGDAQAGGRKRLAPASEKIAARVAKFCAENTGNCPEGVQPLNAGFFALEAMRQANVATMKARRKQRAKVRGK